MLAIGQSEAKQKRAGLLGLSRGWAIGTAGWRRTMAKEFSHLRLSGGLERVQARALNEAVLESRLQELLRAAGKRLDDVTTKPK